MESDLSLLLNQFFFFPKFSMYWTICQLYGANREAEFLRK